MEQGLLSGAAALVDTVKRHLIILPDLDDELYLGVHWNGKPTEHGVRLKRRNPRKSPSTSFECHQCV